MFLFVKIYSAIPMHFSRYPEKMNYFRSDYSFLALTVCMLLLFNPFLSCAWKLVSYACASHKIHKLYSVLDKNKIVDVRHKIIFLYGDRERVKWSLSTLPAIDNFVRYLWQMMAFLSQMIVGKDMIFDLLERV